MEIRKLIPAVCLSTLLALSACTSAPEPEPETTTAQELRVVTETTAMYRALGAVYAAQLEDRGYRVTVLEPNAHPAQLVRDGQAEVAIGPATSYARGLEPSNEPSTSASDPANDETSDPAADAASDPADDGVLSREEIIELLAGEPAEQFSALEVSPGDLGQVLVMSPAQLTLNEVENLDEVIAACQDIEFAAPAAAQEPLQKALEAADCPTTALLPADAGDPAELLRTGQAAAVVLSRTRALIPDEGFIPIPGSAEIFDSEPVLGLVAAELDAEVGATVAEVTASLNDETLTAVNRMVQGPDAAAVEDIARHWEWLIH